MAGHSHAANVARTKEKNNKKQAKLFTKMGRLILSAAKSGLPDPENNTKLRAAIANAKSVNMPKDRILSIIKSVAEGTNKDDYQEMTYEGYGPGNIAVIVSALTDNKNRTAGEVRHVFSKYGGNLGSFGSVSFMFDRAGIMVYDRAICASYDEMFSSIVEANASDVREDGENYIVESTVEYFNDVKQNLEGKYGPPKESRLAWITEDLSVLNEEKRESFGEFLDAMEDNDDVQYVEHNCNLD